MMITPSRPPSVKSPGPLQSPSRILFPSSRGSILGGQVKASYDLSWQELSRSRDGWLQLGRPTDGQRPASRHVQHQMGNFLKSALRLVCTKATFDDPFFPTSGFGIQ